MKGFKKVVILLLVIMVYTSGFSLPKAEARSISGRRVKSRTNLVIRKYARSSATNVGILLRNTSVLTYRESGSWTKISGGWVATRFLYDVASMNKDVPLRRRPAGNIFSVIRRSTNLYMVAPYTKGWSYVVGKGYVRTNDVAYRCLTRTTIKRRVIVRSYPSSKANKMGYYTKKGTSVKYRYVNNYWIYIPELNGYCAYFAI